MVAGMVLQAGATIEQVAEHYNLTYAEVHAALAYYYDNQAAFERENRDIQPLIDQAKRETQIRLEQKRKKAGE
jgi:hypothetical protein